MLFVRSMVCVVVVMGGCARPEPAAVVSPDAAVAPAEGATSSAPAAAAEDEEPFDPTPELGPDGTPTRETLERGHILAGTRGPKAAARERCKSLARAREVVRIRISIAGATGKIETAAAAEGQVDSPLVECVARELRAAVFRRVQKQHTGTTVSVEF